MKGAVAIDPFVLDVLRRGAIVGRVFRLPVERLAKPDYAAVDTVLRGMGGRWDRRRGGHLFEVDPAGPIGHAIATGTYVDRKKSLQQFETPDELAREMVTMAAIDAGMQALEPSAGTGIIVQAMLKRTSKVAAIEIDPLNCESLRELGIQYWCADFLQWAPAHQSRRFDRVVMNPPFTSAQDIAHVTAAWPLVKPGGRLVAILSDGAFTRSEWQARLFQSWLRETDAEIRELPAGTFRGSGTMVRARLISATREA